MRLYLTGTTVMIDSALVTKPLLIQGTAVFGWFESTHQQHAPLAACSHTALPDGFDLAAVHEAALCFRCSTSSLVFTNI